MLECMVLRCPNTPTTLLVVHPAPMSGAERTYCDEHVDERRRLFRHRVVDERPIRTEEPADA